MDKIYLTWSTYSQDDVTEYILYQDSVAVQSGLSTTTTSVSGLTPGQIYSFQISAKNLLGEGPLSPAVSIRAAATPQAPDPVTIAMDAAEVKISWTYPTVINNAPVTSFKVLILNKLTSLYVENQSLCNGSSGSVFSCNVQMT